MKQVIFRSCLSTAFILMTATGCHKSQSPLIADSSLDTASESVPMAGTDSVLMTDTHAIYTLPTDTAANDTMGDTPMATDTWDDIDTLTITTDSNANDSQSDTSVFHDSALDSTAATDTGTAPAPDTESAPSVDSDSPSTDGTDTVFVPPTLPDCNFISSYTGPNECGYNLTCPGTEVRVDCSKTEDDFDCTCKAGPDELMFTIPVPDGDFPCLTVADMCRSTTDVADISIDCNDTEEVVEMGDHCESIRSCTRSVAMSGGILATLPFTEKGWCSEDPNGWQCMCRPSSDLHLFYMPVSNVKPCSKLAQLCGSDSPIVVAEAPSCTVTTDQVDANACSYLMECRQSAKIDQFDISFGEYFNVSCNQSDSEYYCHCNGGGVDTQSFETGNLSNICESFHNTCFPSIEITDIVDGDSMQRVVFDTDTE